MAKTFATSVINEVLASPTKPIFAERAAALLADINAGHPFREGNGRTQLAYLKLVAVSAGYGFNDDALEPRRVLDAMIASFSGDLRQLTLLLTQLIE